MAVGAAPATPSDCSGRDRRHDGREPPSGHRAAEDLALDGALPRRRRRLAIRLGRSEEPTAASLRPVSDTLRRVLTRGLVNEERHDSGRIVEDWGFDAVEAAGGDGATVDDGPGADPASASATDESAGGAAGNCRDASVPASAAAADGVVAPFDETAAGGAPAPTAAAPAVGLRPRLWATAQR